MPFKFVYRWITDVNENSKARSLWILVDQAISSLTNFLLSLVVARTATVAEFGTFSIVFTLLVVVTEGIRLLSLEPLLIRFSGSKTRNLLVAGQRAASHTLVLSLCISATLLITAGIVVNSASQMLLVISIFLPGLAMQDFCRFFFFALGSGRGAVIVDISKAICLLGGLTIMVLNDIVQPWIVLAVWGISGTVSGFLCLAVLQIRPRVNQAWSWYREHRDIAPWFFLEGVIQMAALNLTFFTVAAVGGLVAAASFNGARVLMAPVGVAYLGFERIAVTEGVRMRHTNASRASRTMKYSAVVLSFVSLGWMIFFLWIPLTLGVQILGESFMPARDVLFGFGIFYTGQGIILIARCGFRVFQLAKESLAMMKTWSPIMALSGVTGAFLNGAQGAAWALAVASILGGGHWWIRLRTKTSLIGNG